MFRVKAPASPEGQAPNCSRVELRAPPGEGNWAYNSTGQPASKYFSVGQKSSGVRLKQKDTEVQDKWRYREM